MKALTKSNTKKGATAKNQIARKNTANVMQITWCVLKVVNVNNAKIMNIYNIRKMIMIVKIAKKNQEN